MELLTKTLKTTLVSYNYFDILEFQKSENTYVSIFKYLQIYFYFHLIPCILVFFVPTLIITVCIYQAVHFMSLPY